MSTPVGYFDTSLDSLLNNAGASPPLDFTRYAVPGGQVQPYDPRLNDTSLYDPEYEAGLRRRLCDS